MIKVEGLKKVYTAKKGTDCAALDGVSFTLPEQGMVFVVGKSGSGKSTLLKLLGGLDSLTDGEITVGDKRFSEFSETDYDNYRNNFVGFIFQDFCLINGMTVFENAALSLDLSASTSYDEVKRALEIVDLSGYDARYPKELSGGQQQRVSIARALVKKPRIILADEPTGNLDKRTAKQVMDYLKELSRDRLVITVSHNIDDAEIYADRIIELEDGRIVRDVSRRDGAALSLVDGNVINLPTGRRLTSDELEQINSAIKSENAVISQTPDDFVATDDKAENIKESSYTPVDSKVSAKTLLRIGTTLSKGNRIHAFVTAIMVALLLIFTTLCRVFAMFDGEALIHDTVSNSTSSSLTLSKGYYLSGGTGILKTDNLVEVTDSDIQRFYDSGYEGKVYKLYNMSAAILADGWNTLELGEHIDFSNVKSPYINLASGVLECEQSFLDGIYGGENGEIEIIAGDLNDPTPRSLIITDYFADCILKRIPTMESYQDIIDDPVIGYTQFDVKAIVKTGYAERYATLIDEFIEISKLRTGREAALEQMRDREDFIAFYSEIRDYLSVCYYFGDDYERYEIDYVQSRKGTSFDNIYLSINGNKFAGKQWAYMPAEGLTDNEIRIPGILYNEFMGTSFNNEELSKYFRPFEVTLYEYPFHSAEGEPLYEKTFTVTGISYGPVLFSYTEYLKIYEVHLYPYALYFDNTASAASTFLNIEKSGFFIGDEYYKTIYTIMDIVEVFRDFFLLLYVGIILVCAMLLVGFARRSIKRRMFEVGVLRALGCKNKTVACAFMINMVQIAIFVAVISIVSVRVLDSTLNRILIENLEKMFDTALIKNLHILRFSILSALVDTVTILLLGFVASFGVFRSCRRIKPMSIIQNRD